MVANLKSYIADVIDAEMSSITLGDVAYSLSLRPSYQHRHICLVKSLEDARDQLQAIISKGSDVGGGDVQKVDCSESLETARVALLSALDGNDRGGQLVTYLHQQASLWHKGAKVEFSTLYQSGVYSKAPLPGYVFVKERLWIEPAVFPDEVQPLRVNVVNEDEVLAPSKPNLYCYEWRAQPVILNNARQNNRSGDLASESLSNHLVFWDVGGVAKARYHERNDCINVINADVFSQQSDSQFSLQMESAEQLKELAEALSNRERPVTVIENCAFLDVPSPAPNISRSSAADIMNWQQQ
jgi:acyl transferase domain-containing protein